MQRNRPNINAHASPNSIKPDVELPIFKLSATCQYSCVIMFSQTPWPDNVAGSRFWS